MNIKYDQQVDAAYLMLETAKIVDSEEIQPNVVFDYDELDRIVGIELLSVKRNITNLLQLQKLIPTAQVIKVAFDSQMFFDFLVESADLNLIDNEQTKQRISMAKKLLESSPSILDSTQESLEVSKTRFNRK
ncbi:Protein of unknown function (DUF2283) [Synechococcus sp. PCC 7502]|uniref:DUF2283 domain-containing protein n=1 Tax=Synechococcus sp. PCC 7502 TaxID=1173263 RepID=UPI00029FC57D|nr:DUF2283 domain-containing protein [Synechococcus sp. PCC 7502]AFY73769.1 Protein of unknown function (DUF2283) [Synechococcus sp. PCC 7502]